MIALMNVTIQDRATGPKANSFQIGEQSEMNFLRLDIFKNHFLLLGLYIPF